MNGIYKLVKKKNLLRNRSSVLTNNIWRLVVELYFWFGGLELVGSKVRSKTTQ